MVIAHGTQKCVKQRYALVRAMQMGLTDEA